MSFNLHRSLNATRVRVFFVLILLLGGCSTFMHKNTAQLMSGMAEKYTVPYTMASHDLALACSMSEAFSAFFLSLRELINDENTLPILFWMMSGQCDAEKAWAEELRYLRSVYMEDTAGARDALFSEKRLLMQAATRYWRAYQEAEQYFQVDIGQDCPSFRNEFEQLAWLMAMLSGVQAVYYDNRAERLLAVPLDIANKAGRAAMCVEGQQWWGVPIALHAAVQMTLAQQDQVERSAAALKQAGMIGVEQGVRLALVLEAQVYLNRGNTEAVRRIIASFFMMTPKKLNVRWALFDKVAQLQMQMLSDRLWTEATGSRTPPGMFGRFWDETEQNQIDAVDIEELL